MYHYTLETYTIVCARFEDVFHYECLKKIYFKYCLQVEDSFAAAFAAKELATISTFNATGHTRVSGIYLSPGKVDKHLI